MPIRSDNLHGFVPDNSGAALLLIDVINDFEFDRGDDLLNLALPVGRKIAELKKSRKRMPNRTSINTFWIAPRSSPLTNIWRMEVITIIKNSGDTTKRGS